MIRRSSERGAVALWAAAALVTVVGAAALVVDVGALSVEKADLQAGADAAALAVAGTCVDGACGDVDGIAARYAAANAIDGATAVDDVCGVGPGLRACAATPAEAAGASGWVEVDTSTSNPAGADPTRILHRFARIFGDGEAGRTVRASATVAWGVPRTAAVAPLAISHCEYTRAGGVLGAAAPPTGQRSIEFHTSASGGCVSSSGAALPGGFGWLTPETTCSITLELGSSKPVATGASPPGGCNPMDWVGRTIVFPVFAASNGLTGSNGVLEIGGWIGLAVTGVKFPGSVSPKGLRCPSGGSANCIVGEFRPVELVGGGTGFAGPGFDYGVRVVRLVR